VEPERENIRESRGRGGLRGSLKQGKWPKNNVNVLIANVNSRLPGSDWFAQKRLGLRNDIAYNYMNQGINEEKVAKGGG